MKAIVFLAILGLTLAGFRHDMKKFGHDLHKAGRGFVHDMKKAGHWVEKHHEAIEHGLEDAWKVGSWVAEHAAEADGFVNVDGLIENGVQTYEDATQKNKNIGSLVKDGLNIIGDLTSGNGNSNSNSEELFSWQDAIKDAGSVAGIVSTGIEVAGMFGDDQLVNVVGLIENGVQTYEDATQKNKNIGSLVKDGLNIVGDLTSGNSEELFSWQDALHDAGAAAGVISTGIEVAGMFGDDQLVNVVGLIENGVQTYEDATQKNKNIGSLVKDGLNIVGDLTSGNSEELFSWSDALHDAGSVAGIVGAGIKVAGLFADAA